MRNNTFKHLAFSKSPKMQYPRTINFFGSEMYCKKFWHKNKIGLFLVVVVFLVIHCTED